MDTQIVKSTFYITYVLLLTTATITIIEAIGTDNKNVRHIMNLETCISVVASYFYSQFIKQLSDTSKPIDYGQINKTRYIDWFITTPLMLLVLGLVLSFNDKQKFHILSYVLIVVLNYGMLGAGYMGEIGMVSKNTALLIGFAFFFALFGYIWILFINENKSWNNLAIYGVFFVLWTIYGLVYTQKEEVKNTAYNILDLFAKCLVGIFFWMYFANVLSI